MKFDKKLGPREAHKSCCMYRDGGNTCTCSRGTIKSKEHEKLVQTYKPKPQDWQREVNRIISAGIRVAPMVYNIWSWPDGRNNPSTCSRYTINLDDSSITVEEQ